MQVAVLGTGTMGAGMARSLRRAGIDVRAWNRTRSRAEPLAADGIDVAVTVTDVVGGADAVITILFDTDSVLAVADELVAALGPDAVWLQASTIGADGTKQVVDHVGDAVRLLDAPVLGTKKPAEDGQLVPLVSGPADFVAAAQPVLDAIGARTVVAGERLGEASALKLVCNAWIASINAATAQSMALAQRLDVDPQQFLDAIDGGAVNSPYAQLKGAAILREDFTPSFTVDGVVKDLGLIIDAGEGAGLDSEVLTALRARYAAASAGGHGGDDMAAVVTAF